MPNYFSIWNNHLFNIILFFLYDDYKNNECAFNDNQRVIIAGRKDLSPIPLKAFLEESDSMIEQRRGRTHKPQLLLNATKLTNFRYKLSQNLSAAQVEEINQMEVNGHADIQGRVRAILNSGATLDFDTISPNKNGVFMFYENLLLVDSSMPEILARLLVLSYSTDTRRLDQLTDIMTDLNPLGFPMTANTKYYEAKVKRFITDVALGLLPSQPWEATRQSSGILVVTEKGDIDCYHVIYTAALEDYLFHDLKFETASAKRHGFGSIVCGEDGNQYFTLNLQLRFIR